MNNIIVIDGKLYKLNKADLKEFKKLSEEPDKTSYRGNMLERSISDDLYGFINEVAATYNPIGDLLGYFNL